ncbi:MAG: hypothetical protein ACI87E_001387 [Mariniblastus sp.]|jgi:hypothetical protein
MRDEIELIQLKDTVGQLEQLGHRGSATKNERFAADLLLEQLESRSIDCELEAFCGQSSYGSRILIHLVLGMFGLGILFWIPVVSLLISLVALVSFLAETLAFPIGVSSLLSMGRSQNVVGRISATKTARRRIVLCAHMDTQRTGWIWNASRVKNFTSTLGLAPGPLKAPLFLLTLVLVVQLALAVLVIAGLFEMEMSVLVIPFGFFYAFAMLLVGQWSIGAFVPGANDNATGVACVVALASRWGRTQHDETELVVLFTGCEESGSIGASSWAQRHSQELAQVPTVFLNLDTLGCRQLHYLKHECALNGAILEYPQPLLELCQTVAHEMRLEFTLPHRIPTQTDGLAFLVRGIPGITLTSSESGIFVPDYHLMSDRFEKLNFVSIQRATDFAWALMIELEQRDEEQAVKQSMLDIDGAAVSIGLI